MAKKNNTTTYIIIAIIILIIIVVGYKKYGGVQDEGEVLPPVADDTVADDTVADDTTPPVPERKTTQTLYPDLCYAEGGIPRSEEMGCMAGEVSIGEVPGFKTPHICCVD